MPIQFGNKSARCWMKPWHGSLQEKQGALVAHVDKLSRQRNNTASQLSALQSKNEQLQRDAANVLRLRAEIGQLRRQSTAHSLGVRDAQS
jgi:seryl-tRNA synthetase